MPAAQSVSQTDMDDCGATHGNKRPCMTGDHSSRMRNEMTARCASTMSHGGSVGSVSRKIRRAHWAIRRGGNPRISGDSDAFAIH